MAWIYISLAGIFEIIWALGLKFSNGFTIMLPSLLTAAAIVVSFFFFSKALRKIPIGTAYAFFTGIGAAGTVIIGMLFLNESVHAEKLFFIALLILGIIGLKLTSGQNTGSE